MKKKNKRKEKMHNNKINKDGFEKGDFIYIKKQDVDNAKTYGFFNNANEKEEYTEDGPKPNPGEYYEIEVFGIRKFK